MKLKLCTFLLLTLTSAAIAADAPPTPPSVSPLPPNVIVISREALQGLLGKINAISELYPDAITPAFRTSFTAVLTCINDNSVAPGPQDQCPAVTASFAALRAQQPPTEEPKAPKSDKK